MVKRKRLSKTSWKRIRVFLVLLIIGRILVGGLALFIGQLPNYKVPDEIECTIDEDCEVGGCNGEVCTIKEKIGKFVTTCVWLPGYECLKETSCRCINGKCQWEQTLSYRFCMRRVKELR